MIVQGEGWDGDYQLEFTDGGVVYEGDQIVSAAGIDWVVTGGAPPHKPSSTGRVYVSSPDVGSRASGSYYPSVFNMKWVPKCDGGVVYVLARLRDLEIKVVALNTRTIELQAQILELNPNRSRCEDPIGTLEQISNLIHELEAWQDDRNLPHTSADEIDLNKLSIYDANWVQNYIERWDDAQAK